MTVHENKHYAVFRKTFHVPKEWLKKDQFQHLINHRYLVKQASDALCEIRQCFRELGYMEDNDMMIHDYLHFMLMDILDKNGEVYLTEKDIRGTPQLHEFFDHLTPDFVIRRGGALSRTLIVEIYTGITKLNEKRSKYKKFEYFADVCVVTQHDFHQHLGCLLSQHDIDYLYKHYQLFLTEYYYWKACIKLQKVILNESVNVPIEDFPDRTVEQQAQTESYINDLSAYAMAVAKQERI